jgi:hypothetical protein
MTKYEEQILYPEAKRLLQLLGYNTDEEIHAQFINRYQNIVLKPGRPKKSGRPFGYKKKPK